MNNLIDTHCHLNFPQFRNNLDEIVERAIKSGISKIVTISIKLKLKQILNPEPLKKRDVRQSLQCDEFGHGSFKK